MKKAKEYAKEILDIAEDEDLAAALIKAAQTVKDLFAEYEEIIKMRKITKYAAMLAVFKEQHIKWVAVCRRVNDRYAMLNENAFLEVIQEKMTMIYPNLMQII